MYHRNNLLGNDDLVRSLEAIIFISDISNSAQKKQFTFVSLQALGKEYFVKLQMFLTNFLKVFWKKIRCNFCLNEKQILVLL